MLSCIFGKCSSETYVVNQDFKAGIQSQSADQKPSIIGTRISSKEIDYSVLETGDDSQNRQTSIQRPDTHAQTKQNGRIVVTTDKTSTQLSQTESKNHTQVSQTRQNARSPTVAEGSNHTHVSQRTENVQTSIAAERPNHIHTSQIAQNVQISTASEGANRAYASQGIENVQTSTATERADHESQVAQNVETSTAAERSNHTQASQIAQNVQTSATTERINHTQKSQIIQNVQTSTAAERSDDEHVSQVAQNVEMSTAAEQPNHTQTSQIAQNVQTSKADKTTHAQVSHVTQNVQNSTTLGDTKSTHAPQSTQNVPIAAEEKNKTQVSQQTQGIKTSAGKEKVHQTQIKQNGQSLTAAEETNETEDIQISKLKDENKNKETQSKKSHAPQPPRQKSNEGKSISNTQNGSSVENISRSDEAETVVTKTDSRNENIKSKSEESIEEVASPIKRRSGLVPIPVNYDEDADSKLPVYPKSQDDEALIREAIERNDFLNKIISGKSLDDVVNAMYNKDISAKEIVVKQGEKGSHMYISAKGTYQILIKNKVVDEFSDVRVFGELALLYNAKRLATIKALTPGKVWVLDRNVYQQITVGYIIRKQDEIIKFLMNNEKLKVVGKEALQEVSGLLKSEFFKAGTQIVRQGDKGNKFYIISAGTVTITKDGEGVVGVYKKGDCFGELALLKEDCRQATVTADAPGVECLTLTRKQFVDHFGDIKEWEYINVRPQDSFKDGVTEHGDIDLRDLKIIKTLGVGGFGRVELVQHKKKSDLVFALKYLKKIDIVMQHQQEHVYNEKNIQMACKSPFIVRLYRTYKDNKYIYLLMESCLGGDLWSLLQKQKLRRFEEKEARFIAACVLESFEYLHSRGIIYRDLKPENLLIAVNGYIKLTDFGFAKKISSRGKTFTFAGTPEYVAPEIVLNRGHDRSVDYWAFGAFIFELLTGRTPFRTDDSSHMKTYNKILSGIDNVQFPSYVNLKARHIVEKLCRPVPSERLGMQRSGIKAIKEHKWFLGFDWQKFTKCEMPSPFKPKLKNQVDTQYFDQFKKDTDIPPDELSGWDTQF